MVRRAKIQASLDSGVAPSIVGGDFEHSIVQRSKGQSLVKPKHIESMLAFDFAVVLRGTDPDAPVLDAKLPERQFKACGFLAFLSTQSAGELETVVGLPPRKCPRNCANEHPR